MAFTPQQALQRAIEHREIFFDEMVDLMRGSDLLVVDCLRREPHPTHAHLGMALELATAAEAARVVLTHLDKSMDYATVSREVPPHVLVGYDGMELRV